MNKITNDNGTFGFIWTVDSAIGNFTYGRIQIIIGHEIYPKYCPENYYTVSMVFSNLRGKSYPGGSDGKDFGERKFDVKKYNSLKLKNVFSIETSEMGQTHIYNKTCEIDCLMLKIAYSGGEERLFYSFDYGYNYREIRFPKGTVETVIEALPTYEELLDDRLYKERLAKVLENTSITYSYE
jgi:hypothetical protein